MAVSIPFDNSYARLPDRFYGRLDPTPVAQPKLVRVNTELARQLGIAEGAANNTSHHASTEPTNTRSFDSSQPYDRRRSSSSISSSTRERHADGRATHVLV